MVPKKLGTIFNKYKYKRIHYKNTSEKDKCSKKRIFYRQIKMICYNNNVKYYQIRIFTNLEWCVNMVINHRTHSF
jgi:hypothetical protein